MKYNSVYLYGRVKSLNEPSKNTAEIEVVRGKRFCGNTNSQKKHDIITIIADVPDLIEEIKTWKINDMVEVKGTLVAEVFPFITTCRYCGKENIRNFTYVYVLPVYLGKREQGKSRKEINQLLMDKKEISNQIVIGGTLSTPVQQYIGKDEINAAIYTIKNERRGRYVKEDKTEDSFLVRSYGQVSKQDSGYLKRGSITIIDGSLQSQKSKHNIVCEHCNHSYNWTFFSLEIIPYSSEYISIPGEKP